MPDQEKNQNTKELKHQENKLSQEEQIGFHKGSISVLNKERAELLKIVNVVEQLIKMHLKALSDLGVELNNQENNSSEENQNKKQKKPIDEILTENNNQ